VPPHFSVDDRSKANGIINLMGGIGSLMLSGRWLSVQQLWRAAPFIAGAVLMVAALSVAFRACANRARRRGVCRAGSLFAPVCAVVDTDRSGLYADVILFWFIAFNALGGLSSFAVFSGVPRHGVDYAAPSACPSSSLRPAGIAARATQRAFPVG
jgi:hypothetical protein